MKDSIREIFQKSNSIGSIDCMLLPNECILDNTIYKAIKLDDMVTFNNEALKCIYPHHVEKVRMH